MSAWGRGLPSVAQSLHICVIVLGVLVYGCYGIRGARSRRQYSDNLFYTSVCEGKTMDLRCPPGKVISISDANFGRVDNVTCTNGPVLTTTCFSENAREIVANGCDQHPSCSIPTTVERFGDACPGTVKYLEVTFECRPAPPTTAPPTTPRPPTTPVATTVATTKRSEPTNTISADLASTPPVDATTVAATTTTGVATTTTVAATTAIVSTVASTTTVAVTTRKPAFCNATKDRDVEWERTPAGETNVQPCPEGHTGQATLYCDDLARWSPQGPDLSGCISPKLQNITSQLDEGASVTVISEELVHTVEEIEKLYGGDIITVTNILTASLGSLHKELENATATEKTEKTKEVTKNYMKVGSAILEDGNQESWEDVPTERRSQTASTLITSLEESAFLLADTLGDDETVVEAEDNVVMEVVVRGQDDDSDLVFPDPNQLTGDWSGVTDSITLPADTIKERTKDGKTKIVLLAYNNIGQFLGTKGGNTTQGPTAVPKADPRPCSAEVVVDKSDEYVVTSRVLSVSINDPWESAPLLKPVNLTFEHQKAIDNLTHPVCSFWKFDNRSGEFLSGAWADQGCVMVHNNETHTVCSCDHLTNFAIIMNVKGIPIEGVHAITLSFITYFGFIVSIPCLILALATFCMFKNLQSDRTTIHKNLCLSLIMAEVIFVAGISQTGNKVVCAIVALLLHFFFLAAFAWMCLEGIQLYIMLVKVFEAESSRRKYYYPFGYILPLFIVVISAAVDFSSYGTPKYCWICAESYLKWSFYAPVCVIILGNISFLSMALFIMCKHSKTQTNPKEKTPKEKAIGIYRRFSTPVPYIRRSSSIISRSEATKTKSLVRGALVLLCLLGVTWVFGLLLLTEDLIVFAYVFTVTNAFQGLFIFIFHCCMNDKVRKEYRRYVRNNTWLPSCIREQYRGNILTNSNQQNSYRSSSAAQKRPDSKRFSNTTGSYSVENRKMSNSSVYRHSGQYEPVKFNSELSVPEESVDFDVPRVIADEGIGMEFEENPVHESTRIETGEDNEPKNNVINNRLSATTEFQPLITDLEGGTEKHAKLIDVKPPEAPAPSLIEMHPLIRESGIGGSRSGSSSSEDFAPASPISRDVPTKAHVFPNRSTTGMTGSMPDLINPLTAHACKARMDLVPVAYNNADNVVDVSAPSSGLSRYHTLPHPLPTPRRPELMQKTELSAPQRDSTCDKSPWQKRASKMNDIDGSHTSLNETLSSPHLSPKSPKSPKSAKSPKTKLLETVI